MARPRPTGPITSSTCPPHTPSWRWRWNRIGWPTSSAPSTSEKLKIQKDVVKNEYRQNYANRPYGMVWSLLAEALYPPQHPYSWLTIGVMEDIERATMDDVSAFFRRYYVPEQRQPVPSSATWTRTRAIALAERYFGPIAGGHAGVAALGAGRRAGRRTARSCVHDRVELDRLYLIWPTVPHFHDDDAPLILLGDILARGRASRLYRKLVIEEQVAQDVSAYQSGRELAGSFGDRRDVPAVAVDRRRPADLVEAELAAIGEAEVGGRGAAPGAEHAGSPASSSRWSTSAGSAASPTGSTPTTSSAAIRA